jgi:hypothetical protein
VIMLNSNDIKNITLIIITCAEIVTSYKLGYAPSHAN